MIAAKTAREKINEYKKEKLEEEKAKIEKEINTAVDNKNSYVHFRYTISNPVIEWLKDLGYKVEKHPDRTTVRW